MREYTEKEKNQYRSLAAIVVKSHPTNVARMNASAKMAIKVMQDACPEADEDTLFAFMGSVCFLMARLMQLPMSEASEVIEGVFDNYALAIASMLGVYDLDCVPNAQETAELNKLFDDVLKRREYDSPAKADVNTGFYL